MGELCQKLCLYILIVTRTAHSGRGFWLKLVRIFRRVEIEQFFLNLCWEEVKVILDSK